MPIAFDRSICCDLNETISREWLITNGIGGYAAGTVAGALTRMQHGLLVASSNEVWPRLLLAKIDEEIVFDQRTYYLGTNEYRDGTINPAGFVHLETFHLEEGFPVFTYRIGGIDGVLLEKRIWMPPELNTTYIQYRVLRSRTPEGPVYRNSGWNRHDRSTHTSHGHSYFEHTHGDQRVLTLKLLPFATYRPCNEPQLGNNDWHFQVHTHQPEHVSYEDEKQQHGYAGVEIAGCTIRAHDGAQPYQLIGVGQAGSETTFIPTGVWYWHFLRRFDQAAGLASSDDLYLPGVFRTRLWPEEDSTFTIVVTAEELSSQTFNSRQFTLSYNDAIENQRIYVQPQRYFGEGGETVHSLPVLPVTDKTHQSKSDEEYFHFLLQAGARFTAKRTIQYSEVSINHTPSPFFNDTEIIPTLIPRFFDIQDNTREMLIALPGLTLATRDYFQAQRILRSLAHHFKQGMLPDRLPIPGYPLKEHDYSGLDTALWFFYALDYYLRISHDYELLDDLYQRLVESISWYMRGTYHGIAVDPHDGLLAASQPVKALTWMNASVKHIPITPRCGKPVEVNALWYHALSLMHEWSQLLYQKGRINHSTPYFQEQSIQCKKSFNERFWYSEGGYLYDVIDGPGGDDLSIRPNQLLAFSLRYPLLCEEHRRSVLDLVSEYLLTLYGLRTLSPKDTAYQGRLKNNLEEQQYTLHQGSAWPWLLGPYIDALLCVESSGTSKTLPLTDNLDLERVWHTGLNLLHPFREQLNQGMLGMIGDVFDGDAPQQRGFTAASALSIGEILRIYNLLTHLGVRYQKQALFI
jgi:glycogen debranching enzyme